VARPCPDRAERRFRASSGATPTAISADNHALRALETLARPSNIIACEGYPHHPPAAERYADIAQLKPYSRSTTPRWRAQRSLETVGAGCLDRIWVSDAGTRCFPIPGFRLDADRSAAAGFHR